MSRLPEGWAEIRLGDVIDYGATVKVEPDEIAEDAWILELEDIEKDSSKVLERFTYAQRKSKSTKNRFEEGDVLYGKLRPYLNKVVVAESDGYCTTEIIPIKPTNATNNRFVFHWLKHPRFIDYATEVSHGLNMPRLGTGAGKSAPFVLAPLPEQKRIADKLDALLARVDAARARLDRVPALLKHFRQSVLAAATSGELTEDWRLNMRVRVGSQSIDLRGAKLAIPKSWETGKLSDRIDPSRPLCYGVVQPGAQVVGGVPLIRVQDMEAGSILRDELRTISASVDAEYRRSKVNASDVLISVVGTIGRVAIVPDGMRANIARAVARIATKADTEPGWMGIWLNSEAVQWWLLSSSKEVARKTLNLSDLSQLPFASPPLEEQRQIVRRVEALFTLADKVQAQYTAARARIDRLTPAILAKAFRGELVPQDPDDEPASVLLERIRARRAAAPAAARRGRRTAKAASA